MASKPHIQKGNLRWDAVTAQPVEHLGKLPPALSQKDIQELIDQGVFDRVKKAHPTGIFAQLEDELEARVFRRLEERGARDLIKGEKRAISKAVLKRLILPLTIYFVITDFAEGGVEKAAKNAIIPGELIEKWATTIIDDWQVYADWWFRTQREKTMDKRFDGIKDEDGSDPNFDTDFPEFRKPRKDGSP